jgi:hypothetical protein
MVLVAEGETGPDVIEMLKSGEVELSGVRPSRARYRLALLKHAFLAGCMEFGIIRGHWADVVRNDLIAARDCGNRRLIPSSAMADGLTVLRYFGPSLDVPPVAVAVAPVDGVGMDGVLLGGRVFVSWSSEINTSRKWTDERREVRLPLVVHSPIPGVVKSVELG